MQISVRSLNIDHRPTTNDRPHGLFTHFGKFQMTIARHPIPFVFVLGGVFGDGGSNCAISRWIKSEMAAGGHVEKIKGPYL